MCGFAGVIAWDNRFRTSEETLRKMSAAIAHRGPDGEGHYINHQGEITRDNPQVALAFRRLAILDPDPRSNQPFTDGRHWLVFNGEIYNFRELRKELESIDATYEWRTTGDTEVLLRAYATWGEKCVEKLNGMFAFAVWDGAEKSLFLARDRMGQKPLYLLKIKSDSLAFASEVNALKPLASASRPIYRPALVHYLQYGTREDLGFAGEIDELRAGRSVAVSTGGYAEQRYFDCNAAVDGPRTSQALSELVHRSVERQLVSDVPLGVFLSGGIDSSVISACARKFGAVQTFSIQFDDPRYDESKFAREVAAHLGTNHHEFSVTPSAVEDLLRLAALFGDPFADSSALPTHYLSRATREHVKVALSGDGGDEMFGGYDRYRAIGLLGRLPPMPGLSTLGSTLAAGHPKSRVTRAGKLMRSVSLPAPARYEALMRIFDDKLILALLPGLEFGIQQSVASTFKDFRKNGRDDVAAALATDRITYLPDDLLTKVDRCSMMHGLEVRSPFMDHEIVQFAAGLTSAQLLKGGPKRMLREAFEKDLPDFVFKRKKMGFAVPIGEWFRSELRPMLRESLFAPGSFARGHFNMPVVERLIDEHESRRVDHSQRLYALLMLELWWQQQRT